MNKGFLIVVLLVLAGVFVVWSKKGAQITGFSKSPSTSTVSSAEILASTHEKWSEDFHQRFLDLCISGEPERTGVKTYCECLTESLQDKTGIPWKEPDSEKLQTAIHQYLAQEEGQKTVLKCAENAEANP